MKVKIEITKTWQEKPFEPFVISLGEEIITTEEEKKKVIKESAKNLQKLTLEIYNERRKV